MKLLRLEFSGDGYPRALTTLMSTDEAALVATVLGRMTDAEKKAVLAGGAAIGSDIYDCLIGDVFNRYWDDGVRDAIRRRNA